MIGGIVLTHGTVGSALIEAATTILGEIDNIYDLSTRNLSLDGIIGNLRQAISTQPCEGGTIIMVSLKGGSCWNAAVALTRQLPQIEVVSGVNLNMLLSFLSKRHRFPVHDLAEIIKEDGIRGIDRLQPI